MFNFKAGKLDFIETVGPRWDLEKDDSEYSSSELSNT